MKRIFSMAIVVILMLSVAVPALAAECYYYDSYGQHAYEQTSFSYPTCTKPGYVELKCRVCSATDKQETGDAYGHDWEASATKEPTCTQKGYIYYTCDECYGEKTESLKALGHAYKVLKVEATATCTVAGMEQVQCSRCGSKTTRETEKLPHSFGEWSIVQEATDASMGVRGRYCLSCGAEQTEEFYPDGTLIRGSKNKDAVMVLQTWLTDCGYLNDKIDGIFGGKTEQAVKDFQTKAGVNADSIAWPETMKLLEREWMILTGAYVEACTRVEDVDGVVEFLYCEEHQQLMDEIGDILASEDDALMNADILTGIRAMYQAEVDALYAEWLESSADEDKANVMASQTMFVGYLNAQETVWNKQYGENSVDALTKINDMLHGQWVDLCGIIDLFCAE